MEMTFSQLLQILAIGGGLIWHWIETQKKLRELDIRLVSLEQRLNSVEKIDDKIMDKLDAISEQINELKIDLSNKQDRL